MKEKKEEEEREKREDEKERREKRERRRRRKGEEREILREGKKEKDRERPMRAWGDTCMRLYEVGGSRNVVNYPSYSPFCTHRLVKRWEI